MTSVIPLTSSQAFRRPSLERITENGGRPGKAVLPPVSQGQRDRVALMILLCCACPLPVEGGKV